MQEIGKTQTIEIRTLGVSEPQPLPFETIEVEVSIGDIMRDYAKAFVNECYRVEPLLAKGVNLIESELVDYIHYLLTKRVEYVHQECKEWRKLNCLWMPAYVQQALSMIGEVKLREDGLRFIPVMIEPSKMTFDEALKVSDKLEMFYGKLQVLNEAMPRPTEGNADVMTCILINGYVRGYNKVSFVGSSYVSAFLDLKLKEEMKYGILFRRIYDDYETIKYGLVRERGVF